MSDRECTCIPNYSKNGDVEHLRTCPRYEKPQMERVTETGTLFAFLSDILTELKRANSTSREGAVSSCEIKFLAAKPGQAFGTPQPIIKAYTGSEVPWEEAIDAYGKAFREAEKRAMDGWKETVEYLAPAPTVRVDAA